MMCDTQPELGPVARPFEKVPIAGSSFNQTLDRCLFVYTIHDGAIIPEDPFARADPDILDAVKTMFINERDWGANKVAEMLAQKLDLSGFHKVNLARAVLDFGRFPGISDPDDTHLTRMSIIDPVSRLDRRQICKVLAQFDRISDGLEFYLEEKLPDEDIGKRELLQIAIHTYDEHNRSGTRRPAVSLILQPHTYRDEARLSWELFDPLFPHQLAEFTGDRTLAYRLASTLERRYLPVGLNFPYPLPEGSVELRSQVWYFFRYLRKHHREWMLNRSITPDPEVVDLVWNMLINPNRRDMHSFILSSYLHEHKSVPKNSILPEKLRLEEAAMVYDSIHRFMAEDPRVVTHYRFAPCRPSSLAIEVRKDWLMEGINTDHGFLPARIRLDRAEELADALAEAIHNYIEVDLKIKKEKEQAFLESADWVQRF